VYTCVVTVEIQVMVIMRCLRNYTVF